MPPKPKQKAKTVPLNEFLAKKEEKTSWADDNEEDGLFGEEEEQFKPASGVEQKSWARNSEPSKPSFSSEQPRQEREYREREFQPRERRPFEMKEIDESKIPTQAPFILYVGNLSYQAQKSDIQEYFGDCQVINVIIPLEKETKKPKGYSYVEFETLDDLKNALDKRGNEFMGRNVKIDLTAQEVAERFALANQIDKRPLSERSRPRESRFPASVADEDSNWRTGGGAKSENAFGGMRRGGRGGFRGESGEEGGFRPRGGFRGSSEEGGFRGRGGFRGGRGGFRGEGESEEGGSFFQSRPPRGEHSESKSSKENPFGEGKPREETSEQREKYDKLAGSNYRKPAEKPVAEGEEGQKKRGMDFNKFGSNRRGGSEEGGFRGRGGFRGERGGHRGGRGGSAPRTQQTESTEATEEPKNNNKFAGLEEDDQ